MPLQESVQLCTICDKPFTKAAAFKRHVSYCRRRAATQPRKRQRSCAHCNAAKLKCSFTNPCSRCSSKGLDCDYGVKPPKPTAAILAGPEGPLLPPDPVSSSSQTFPLLVEQHPLRSNGIAGLMDSSLIPELTQFQDVSSSTVDSLDYFPVGERDLLTDLGTENTALDLDQIYNIDTESGPLQKDAVATCTDLLPWSGEMAESDYENYSDVFYIDEGYFAKITMDAAGATRRHKIMQILPIAMRAPPESRQIRSRFPLLQASSIPSSLSPPLPRPRPLALLARDPVARQNSYLVIETLRAYPAMMTRRQTFPPFIHPHWHQKSLSPLPSPLKSCMSLCKLFVAGGDEGKNYSGVNGEDEHRHRRRCLWEAVDAQQQGFWDNREDSSMDELLAQLQALLMYIIMRAVDGESGGGGNGGSSRSEGGGTSTTPVVHADTLKVYEEICRRLIPKVEAAQAESRMEGPTWSEWIFEESCRRVVCLWFLISRVVDIRDGIWCPKLCNCHEIPLPSARPLWEAREEDEWREAWGDSERRREEGLLFSLFGDLRDARRGDGLAGCSSRVRSRKLAEWSANLDGMGYLANLGTTIV